MLFNTVHFFIFLAVVLALFYASPRVLRKYVLLAASYFFYACWNPKFIALLLTLTAIDYTAGMWMEKTPLGPATQDHPDSEPGGQSRLSGIFQVLQFRRRQRRAAVGEAGPFVLARHRSAAGHQLSHVSEHVLCGGRVPRRAEGHPQPHRLRAVHLLLPATGGRAHRSRARFLPRSAALAPPSARGRIARHLPDRAGADQEDGLRRPVRAK